MERIKNYATALFLCLVLLLQGCLKVDEESFYNLHTGEATFTETGVTFDATIDKKVAQNAREFGVEYKFVYGDDDSDTWKRIVCQKALQNNSFTTLLEFSELEKNKTNQKGELLSQIKYVAYCDFSGSEEIAEERTFQITLCRLTAKSSDEGKGLVTGSGTYCKGSSATITATPKENYYFTGWSDSDTKELTRTITITSDTTITAIFSKNPYLTAKPNNSNYGTVTGSGLYDYGSEATITATPKENYYFTGWSDCDSRELTRTITITSDTTIMAIFSEKPYLTAKPNNSDYGTVTGSGLYEIGTKVTITATPKENYYFTGWSDSDSKELTRTVQVNSDTTIIANFAKKPYLTAKPNNSDYGIVTSSGYYAVGTKVTITATPKENYYFTGWSDCDSKELTRTVQVNSDTTITAIFSEKPYLTAKPNSTTYGTVTGSGHYAVGSEATITATPKENYYLTGWSDCDSKELTRTVQVNSDTTITANFAKNPYLTVKTNNNYGIVEGSGYYEPNTEVTFTATPNYDYIEFVQWNDGNTENPRTITVTSNVTYTATFKVNVPDGAFLVSSSGKCVYFSPGNLQYIQSSDTWQFASCQWECVGTDNVTGGEVEYDATYGYSRAGTALADKVDLFGWSTNTTNFGVSTSEDYDDYSTFVDWGSNQIGDDVPNTWRTLTDSEWYYLRYKRPNYDKLIGVAQVNGVNGLILLPDSWTCPDGVTFRSGYRYSDGVDYYAAYQTFTAAEWSKMEVAGAVFLPAAGYSWRYGSVVDRVQYRGDYWSAAGRGSDNAFNLHFESDEASVDFESRRNFCSVRLVKDL